MGSAGDKGLALDRGFGLVPNPVFRGLISVRSLCFYALSEVMPCDVSVHERDGRKELAWIIRQIFLMHILGSSSFVPVMVHIFRCSTTDRDSSRRKFI